MMLTETNVNVLKKLIMTIEQLYRICLKWVAKSRITTELMEHTYDYFGQLKSSVLALMDSENDGIRSRVIKFNETCCLIESPKTKDSEVVPEDDICLDDVTREHRFISYRKLEQDGKQMFQNLVDVATSQHISSINLIICLQALSRLARLRPDYCRNLKISKLFLLHFLLRKLLGFFRFSAKKKFLF